MITLDELKLYLRLDTDDEDDLLQSMMDTAIEFLSSAGIPQSDSARYKLAVKGLVAHYYDHRDDNAPLGQGVRMLITQLQHGGTVTDG